MSILKQVAIWIFFAACLAPVWGTLLRELWDGSIRPRLVAPDIIERAAGAMLAKHGDRAEQMALIAEDRAWRYSDSFREGCWRRAQADRDDAPGSRRYCGGATSSPACSISIRSQSGHIS